MPEHYRLFVSKDRTVMLRIWVGSVPSKDVYEVATREDPSHTWGPPVILKEEKSGA